MKLSVYMYFFLPSSFFMLLLLYLLKQRSYSIIYEALLCVIFFFVHNDRLSEAVPMRLFFRAKNGGNEDKNTHRLESNGHYSSISLVSVIQTLASS